MLSLGRKPGEYVVIGDDIVIQVISIDGDLRLAIDAPRSVSVVRGEVYEKTKPVPVCVAKSQMRRYKTTAKPEA